MIVDAENLKLDAVSMGNCDDQLVTSTMEIEGSPYIAGTQKKTIESGGCLGEEVYLTTGNTIPEERDFLPNDGSMPVHKSKEIKNNFALAESRIIEPPPTTGGRIEGEMQVLDQNRMEMEWGEKIHHRLTVSGDQNGFSPHNVSNPLGMLVSRFGLPQQLNHFPQTGPISSMEEEIQRRKHAFLHSQYYYGEPSRPPDNSQVFQHFRNIPRISPIRLMNEVERQNYHVNGLGNHYEAFPRQLNNCQEFQGFGSTPQTNLTRNLAQTSTVSLTEKGAERQNCEIRSSENRNEGTPRQVNNYQEFQSSSSIPQTNLTRNLRQTSSVCLTEKEAERQNCEMGSIGNHYKGISGQLNNCQEFQHAGSMLQTNLTRNLQQTSSIRMTEKEVVWQNRDIHSSENHFGGMPRQLDSCQEFQNSGSIPWKEAGRQNCEMGGLKNPHEGPSRQLNNFKKFQHFRNTPQTNFITRQPSPINLTGKELERRNCEIRSVENHEDFSKPHHNFQEFQHFRNIPQSSSIGNLPQTNPINMMEKQNYELRSSKNHFESVSQQQHNRQKFQHFSSDPNSIRNLQHTNLADWAVKEIQRLKFEMHSLKKHYEGFLKQHDYLQEFQHFQSTPEANSDRNPPQNNPTDLTTDLTEKEINRLRYEMCNLRNQYEVCLRRHDKLQEFWRLRSIVETNSIRNLLQSNSINLTEKEVEKRNHDIRSSGNHFESFSRQSDNLQELQYSKNIPQTSSISTIGAVIKARNHEFSSLQTCSEGSPKRKNGSLAKASSVWKSRKKSIDGISVAGSRQALLSRQENYSVAEASFVQESKYEKLGGSGVAETKSESSLEQECGSLAETSFVQKSEMDYLNRSNVPGTRSESSVSQENASLAAASFVQESKKENLSGSSVAETKNESSSIPDRPLAEASFIKKSEEENLSESSVTEFKSNPNSNNSNRGESVSCPNCPEFLQGTAALSCHLRTHTSLEFSSCPACPIRVDSQQQLMYHLRCDHLKISGLQWYQCEICEARFRCSLAFATHLRSLHADEYYFRTMCQRCLSTLELDRQLKSLLAMVRDSVSQSYPCSVKSTKGDVSDGFCASPASSPDCNSGGPQIRLIDLTEAEKEDSDVMQLLDFFFKDSEDENDSLCVKDSLSLAVEEEKSGKNNKKEQTHNAKNSHSGLAQADSSISSPQIDLIDLTEDEIKNPEMRQSVDTLSKDSGEEHGIVGVGDTLSDKTKIGENDESEKQTCSSENSPIVSITADCPTTDVFVCPHCPAEFSHQSSLTKHCLEHSQKKSFKCPYCPKHFKHEHSFYSHLQCHKTKILYQCKFCLQRLAFCCSLVTHLKTVHSEEYWLPGNFGLVQIRQNSEQRDHLVHNLSSPVLNTMFPKTDIQIESVCHLPGAFHLESSTDEPMNLCEFCGDQFFNRSDLMSHLVARHPDEYRFSATIDCEERSPVPESVSHASYHNCPFCPARLTNSGSLSDHVQRFHAEESSLPPSKQNSSDPRPVLQDGTFVVPHPVPESVSSYSSCPFCPVRLSGRSVSNHIKRCHSGESYLLPDRQSSVEYDRDCGKNHAADAGPISTPESTIHFILRLYFCLFCPARYRAYSSYLRHLKLSHLNKILESFPFSGDQSSSESEENSIKAVGLMHGPAVRVECSYHFDGQSYSCLFCPVRYLRRGDLIKHFVRVHPHKLCPASGESSSSGCKENYEQSSPAAQNDLSLASATS